MLSLTSNWYQSYAGLDLIAKVIVEPQSRLGGTGDPTLTPAVSGQVRPPLFLPPTLDLEL